MYKGYNAPTATAIAFFNYGTYSDLPAIKEFHIHLKPPAAASAVNALCYCLLILSSLISSLCPIALISSLHLLPPPVIPELWPLNNLKSPQLQNIFPISLTCAVCTWRRVAEFANYLHDGGPGLCLQLFKGH